MSCLAFLHFISVTPHYQLRYVLMSISSSCHGPITCSQENIRSILGLFYTVGGSKTDSNKQGLFPPLMHSVVYIYTSSQINTALQLALMAQTTITPILPPSLVLPVEPLQFVLHPS